MEMTRRLTMWSIVPRVMTMPNYGWTLARDHGPLAEVAVLRFLLPLSLISGGAEFFSLLYPNAPSFTGALVGAVVMFCSFFLGYYIALVMAKLFLPREERGFPHSQYGRLLAMTGVATLAIFHILFKLLPMFDFIIEFFPLWTIFLLYKGMKIADVPQEKWTVSLAVVCLAVICSPPLVEWIFSLFT